jgi:hypothetical protein
MDYQKGRPYYGGGHERVPPASGHVTAIDLATGKAAWRYDTVWPMYAGVLATGGEVLFVGNPQGELEALEDSGLMRNYLIKVSSGGAAAAGAIVSTPRACARDRSRSAPRRDGTRRTHRRCAES